MTKQRESYVPDYPGTLAGEKSTHNSYDAFQGTHQTPDIQLRDTSDYKQCTPHAFQFNTNGSKGTKALFRQTLCTWPQTLFEIEDLAPDTLQHKLQVFLS